MSLNQLGWAPWAFIAVSAICARSLAADGEAADFENKVVPFLAKHCVGCHNNDKKKGDLVLEFADEPTARVLQSLWQSVLVRLETREMPPPPRPRPDEAELAVIKPWLEAAASAGGAGPGDPGRVTLRRLNRAEYRNTIRDLLGVDTDAAKDFPSDDVGYGFDNIGDVLSLPPLLLEKYIVAAEAIAASAIGDGRVPAASHRRFEGEDMECTSSRHEKRGNKRRLFTAGELRAKFHFPQDGEYVLSARCIAEQAGEELVKMAFLHDGAELKRVDVDAVEGAIKTYQARFNARAGERSIGVAFLNDDVAPPATADRNLLVDWVEIEGPSQPRPAVSASHARIVFCDVAGPDKVDCLRRVLESLATRAFRRPLHAGELDRLIALVKRVENEDLTPEECLRVALVAILVSPHFLFRVELDGSPADAPGIRTLNDHELATRLSYFLWSSMPDDELFALAALGKLRESEVLSAQTRRMLQDSRAAALTENFGAQWLTIRNLDAVTPDKARFPAFDEELRTAMRLETERFFTAIVKEDRSVLDFLDADFTFLNERLARHYGIADVVGPEMRRVALSDRRRGGVLTQASVLTVTSNPTRTSPVKRGKWVLEQLLGRPPPPPPPDAGDLKEEEDGKPLEGTIRQRLEQHRRDPACSSCHVNMDPLGFGLENFDATGAWRETDGGQPIEATGDLPDGRTFRGPRELKNVLMADEATFTRTLAEKLLTFAIGRGLEYHDRRAVEAIAAQTRAGGHRFTSLVLAIVHSEPFQKRRADRRSK